MRRVSVLASLCITAVLVSAVSSEQLPLKQEVEVLTAGPARIDKATDGLFVVRGPFVPCGTRGCRPGGADDGLIHEAGNVAVRVTAGRASGNGVIRDMGIDIISHQNIRADFRIGQLGEPNITFADQGAVHLGSMMQYYDEMAAP
jgi:hypothetical protein